MTSITFTVDQANRTLPLVRRIVEDIVVAYERWRRRVEEYETVSVARGAEGAPTAPDEQRADEIEREAQRLATEIDRCTGELRALGVELKDHATGLVDFRGEREGRIVYLCWRLGEPSVAYWHELDAGVAGRQLIMPVRGTLAEPHTRH